MSKIEIGVIGMAVMGRNLALNMADHGFRVAVYNRSPEPLKQALAEDQTGRLIAAASLEALVNLLPTPRNIVLMVKAGEPVDRIIEQLLPLLSEDDLIIDAGNSYFKDTIRRNQSLREKGIRFLGVGVSGGEEGARFGPAIMPGGDLDAYGRVQHIFEAVSARAEDGQPCCFYTSTDGAGHYVKMVHNGIEYADMQVIAEAYALLKRVLGLSNDAIADIFATFNQGPLNSFLMEIAERILREKDPLADGFLLDKIVDGAAQKGTGLWTNREAIDIGVETSILVAGLNARVLSQRREERAEASEVFELQPNVVKPEQKEVIDSLEQAMLAAKIMAYAQGFSLLQKAAQVYGWDFNYRNIAATFRSGCIIRSILLYDIMAAYEKQADLPNLMLAPSFSARLQEANRGLRETTVLAISQGVGAPAMTSAIAYFDAYRTRYSEANMIQAMRDYFGAHTFERTDREGVFHHEWWQDYLEQSTADDTGSSVRDQM